MAPFLYFFDLEVLMTWDEQMKKSFDTEPLLTIAVVSFAVFATSRLIDSFSNSKVRRAHAKLMTMQAAGRV